MAKVLVTGGSGFIGSHCILQLLAAGHSVNTTVRNAAREADVRALLRAGGAADDFDLTCFVADLDGDAGWASAVEGCDYVLHVASPFPASTPADEDELIRPAREGALRLLRAARGAGVRRMVLTSSFAAIGYGHGERPAVYDETYWSDPTGPEITAYAKSKTLAERAAWDFIASEGDGLELSVVNPVGVFGPVLGADYSTSILLVQRLITRAVPGCPKIYFGVVDVRDVADLHLRAMTDPKAKGERFLATGEGFISVLEIAKILKAGGGPAAQRTPVRELPNWLLRLAALREPALKQLLPELGKVKNATNAKARSVLGWAPRTNAEAILATAESLTRLGLIS